MTEIIFAVLFVSLMGLTRCYKTTVFLHLYFEPNVHTLYANIHATYPVNFIEITDMVPQTQQFKL